MDSLDALLKAFYHSHSYLTRLEIAPFPAARSAGDS